MVVDNRSFTKKGKKKKEIIGRPNINLFLQFVATSLLDLFSSSVVCSMLESWIYDNVSLALGIWE